jgi:hypothetical protein
LKEWPVCLTCRIVAVREVPREFAGRRTKNHRDQQKGSGGRASSMKIASIFINRKLLNGNMVTISDNSQERFLFLLPVRYSQQDYLPGIIAAIYPG